ncbi:type II toxin-antitoxin system HicA family toxin [Hymenobacter gummosus]|uniref:Type II toxin-antitoxin system HicA family toxin n=1 Tax=Hymenobacter gummosus TaxID=1776032 RepID=A0A3S0JDX1_9BACT|nr:type II toxin-antitoxin system HicA family toxin [Hymenobacter gummosus]RTQ46210.1 type II toxin-antitoxin system HicA family toxin [Hymenobacter gummosus]
MKRLELIQHLTKHGCILLREGANHSIYVNTATGQQSTVGRHRELDNLMCRIICRQLGIPIIA